MRRNRLVRRLVGLCGVAAVLGIPLAYLWQRGDGAAIIRNADVDLRRLTTLAVSKFEIAPAKSQLATPRLRFAAVERGSIEHTITVTGSLQPVKTVEVGSQLSGLITKLYVDFNDRVRKGEALAQIDPRTFKAKVDEARSTLEMARANVKMEQAKLDRARVDLQTARGNKVALAAKLKSAQSMEWTAARTLSRQQRLQTVNATPTATVDNAKADLAAKEAAEQEAKTLLTLNAYAVEGAQVDIRRIQAELEQAQAAVPEKEAVLKAAEADLDRTIIRSPIDGIVVGRFVDQGQTLAVGLESRAIFNVAHRLEDMEIHARVDETDIGRIRPGQLAHFTVDAYPDRRFEAVVRQVRKAPQVNQNVVTYTVVLATSNPDDALLPGMTALVKIVTDRKDNVLKVPLAALRFEPQGVRQRQAQSAVPRTQAVWVRTPDGAIKRVRVTVGTSGADDVALKGDNVAEGDQVAVGQSIQPVEHEWFGIRFGS